MTDISGSLRQWVDDSWRDLSLNDFALRPEFHQRNDKAPAWQALAGDAGFRKYFRLASEPSLLAVYAPPETEKNHEFLSIGRLLRKGGVLTPAVAACDLPRGFFLLEDFGPQLLLDVVDEDNCEALYKQAMATLMAVQQCDKDTQVLPPYDAVALSTEMSLFPEWFVRKLLNVELGDREVAVFKVLMDTLIQSAQEQPQVVVHRDYHSRNLVHRENGPPGVIDFQDAVIGPMTYDLVSLLRDCYIQWPEAKVQGWLKMFRSWSVYTGVCPEDQEIKFERWFDLMGLQRHIKVLGIFARLSLRDGKHRYLNDLPLVIDYTLNVARRYPACGAFVEWFEMALMPKIKEQAWWQAERL